MINSIPLEAQVLGITYEEYYGELARTVKRNSTKPDTEYQNIFDKANKKLPKETIKKALSLIESIGYDKEFFQAADLNYAEGGNGCISVSIYDYLLNHQENIPSDKSE
tara:strand:+ start:19542 stop:19865 length:324 start_codon:yes stop_codon:yes gene_type:complete